MGEEHALVRHGDDVVVEGAGRDRFLRLLDENGPLGIEPVQPGDRLRRFDMLAGREGAAAHAIDEQLDSRLAVRRRQPHVVRRALVAERWRNRGLGTIIAPLAVNDWIGSDAAQGLQAVRDQDPV